MKSLYDSSFLQDKYSFLYFCNMKSFGDTDYIYSLIAEGEHQQQDFKFEISDARKIAKTFSAFANTDGGKLLIGVKDNGRIAGVRSEEEMYMIESAAQLFCIPEIKYTMQVHHIEKRTVLEVDVKENVVKPVYAKDEYGKLWAYIRIADENILATPVHIRVWKQADSPLGELVEYTEREQFLLDYLNDNEYISFNQYCRKGHVSRFEAKILLSKFIRFGIAEPYFVKHKFYFRLCNKFPKDLD